MSKQSDFTELLEILTVPRLNGSAALTATRQRLTAWLDARGIASRLHAYRLYPYFLEIGGAWLVVSQLLLALSVWFVWGWLTLPIAVLGIAIPLAEIRGIPIVSRFISKKSENIIIEFEPDAEIKREIILTAHYDSKTEAFSDKWRAFFASKAPLGFLLSLLIAVVALVTELTGWTASYWLGVTLTLPLLLIFLPLGLTYMIGRFAAPSQGAVDNGGSCAVLLTLAEQIAQKELPIGSSKITIVLFSGEEVIVQGSRAYVADRDFPHPTYAINLELIGQNGDFHIWRNIGSAFESYPVNDALTDQLSTIVQQQTDSTISFSPGPAGTDTLPFLKANIPSTCLSSRDKQLGMSGLHTPADNLERIDRSILVSTQSILTGFIYLYART